MAARDLSNVSKDLYDYLSEVAYSEESKYNRKNLMQAAAMESEMGLDTKAFKDPDALYYGLMQSGVIMDEVDNESLKYPDINRAQAAEYYGREVSDRTSNKGKWRAFGANRLALDLGIDDPGFLEYMSWQQGREGTMKILAVLSGESFTSDEGNVKGEFNSIQRDRLISNITTQGREELSSYDDQTLAQVWLEDSKQRWEDYGREIMQLGKKWNY